MRALFAAILLAALVSGSLSASEKATPALQRSRQTSAPREISLRPLFVYSSRGRHDPFMFDLSLASSPAKAGSDFHISELKLVGFMGEETARAAIFYNLFRRTSYRFSQGQLYSPEGIAMANVTGSILRDRSVSLTQGESSIVYKLAGNARIQSLEATIAQDRKELQR